MKIVNNIRFRCCSLVLLSVACVGNAWPESMQKVIDIPTRKGVSQRMVVMSPKDPKASVILFAGGHGGLQIDPDGSFKWGKNNFLIRTRQLFADQGLLVVIVDAPSDRQTSPYLTGFRQTDEHVADIKSVIAWLRNEAKVPVWLIGTSRGTQSAAYIATQLTGAAGPDGLVLTSTILTDNKSRAVTEMSLDKINIPVLVVHHKDDGCQHCAYSNTPALMEKLARAPAKKLLPFEGGEDHGDPCESMAHHGFNGLEHEVVTQIASWIIANNQVSISRTSMAQ